MESYDGDRLFSECDISYLLLYVVQRIGGVDGEADEDDMRVGI